MIDWRDPKNLEFVGKTANNSYYMVLDSTSNNDNDHGTADNAWGFVCGNGTTLDHFFTMTELQNHGWETGSVVRDSKLLDADAIIDLARDLLGMAIQE